MAHAQKPYFVFRWNGRVHLNRPGGCHFSWLLAAEVCASAVVMLDTPCSEVVWRVLATHCIRHFPLHFSSRASPCAITFQLHSNSGITVKNKHPWTWISFRNGTIVVEILMTAQKNENMPASKCHRANRCVFSSTETYELFLLVKHPFLWFRCRKVW